MTFKNWAKPLRNESHFRLTDAIRAADYSRADFAREATFSGTHRDVAR
jgi:hypothetical protein